MLAAGALALVPYQVGPDGRTLAREGLAPVAWALAAPAFVFAVEAVDALVTNRIARMVLGLAVAVPAVGGAMTTWFLMTFHIGPAPELGLGFWAMMGVQQAGLLAGLWRIGARARAPSEGRATPPGG